MGVRTRGIHLNGVRTWMYRSATRQGKNACKVSVWLPQMYCMLVSPFSLKVGTKKSLVETAHRGIDGSSVHVELWRARIRSGCYQVDGQTLATCILVKEARFFQL
jgi:hypothetical protein